MEKLRVGFIGAGRISDLHAIEYLSNPRAELVAVCDTVPENAQAMLDHLNFVAHNLVEHGAEE